MNPDTTFERELQEWLATEAPASGLAGLHDTVLERCRTARQRPSWLVSLRGGAFPSPAGAIGRPDARLTYVLVVLGLILALIAVAIAAGALRSRPVRVLGWTTTGSMIDALAVQEATLLPNGKVLVTGATWGDGLASAQLYDPVSGTWTASGTWWTATGSMSGWRMPLLDGRVLVAGGGRDGTSAELYDPANGTWTATGSMVTQDLYQITATLLPDGRVLVAGGGPDGTSAELYDPASGAWTATGSMGGSCCRSAMLLPDGRVLSAGGGRDGTSAELYDPASGTWTATGSMVTRHLYRLTATLLSNGKVLVAGGLGDNYDPLASAELYDPTTGSWTATGNMITPRAEFSATLLKDGKVLVAGGRDRSLGFVSVPSLASAELYDPVSGTWTATAAMITPRVSYTATLLPDGRVLVAGGFGSRSTNGDDPPTAFAELYDPGSP